MMNNQERSKSWQTKGLIYPSQAVGLLCLMVTVLCGCTKNQKSYDVKGVVVQVKPQEKQVEIKHEAIPGYMAAMTMSFDVKDTNELAGLLPGDAVSFRMTVTEKDGWIDQIRKMGNTPTGKTPTNEIPKTGEFRMVRDVEPLDIGDRLPEYHFTNQFGQRISTAQFKGQALAINFLFTRCPFPTYCPLTANNFAETQQKLLSIPNAPTNWHLLTISFDPDFDKPVVLKAYGERYKYDPQHWSLFTGELIDITAIAEQFGQTFWHDETGSISHNMRAAVIDAAGRVQKNFVGNTWKSDELVKELVKAAAAKN
jgi:protein SCO1/2